MPLRALRAVSPAWPGPIWDRAMAMPRRRRHRPFRPTLPAALRPNLRLTTEATISERAPVRSIRPSSIPPGTSSPPGTTTIPIQATHSLPSTDANPGRTPPSAPFTTSAPALPTGPWDGLSWDGATTPSARLPPPRPRGLLTRRDVRRGTSPGGCTTPAIGWRTIRTTIPLLPLPRPPTRFTNALPSTRGIVRIVLRKSWRGKRRGSSWGNVGGPSLRRRVRRRVGPRGVPRWIMGGSSPGLAVAVAVAVHPLSRNDPAAAITPTEIAATTAATANIQTVKMPTTTTTTTKVYKMMKK
mmetsp:Transcript_32908/g.66343  ORF Transcript_32908/g.66343 Transcript_32908/m.66343 type:complete len:298 (+) Transcript_32908:469-1362(+)